MPKPGVERFPIAEHFCPPGRRSCYLKNVLGYGGTEALPAGVPLDGTLGHRKKLSHLADRQPQVIGQVQQGVLRYPFLAQLNEIHRSINARRQCTGAQDARDS